MKQKYNIKDVMCGESVDGRYLGAVRDKCDLFFRLDIKESGNLYCGDNVAKYIQLSHYFKVSHLSNSGNADLGKWKSGNQTLQVFLDSDLKPDDFIFELY